MTSAFSKANAANKRWFAKNMEKFRRVRITKRSPLRMVVSDLDSGEKIISTWLRVGHELSTRVLV